MTWGAEARSMLSMNPRTVVTTGLLALAILPANAQATPSPCFAELPGPAGEAWKIGSTGSLETRLAVGDDRAFAAGHGALKIGGVPYPSIGNAGCDRNGNTLSFPKRSFGNFEVSRSVSTTSDGRLRFLDTVRNKSAQLQLVDLDFGIEITETQIGFESEDGDDNASSHDDWFVLKEDSLYPFLQWGLDGNTNAEQSREAPDVMTPADVDLWSPSFTDGDESARFDYHADLIPGETVRFLHVTGAVGGNVPGAAVDQAKDGATPFRGYSQAIAKTVINWGPDPDKDGVGAANDACPGITGNQGNGCPQFIAEPVPPADPAPAPTDPQPGPGEQPAPPAAGGHDGPGRDRREGQAHQAPRPPDGRLQRGVLDHHHGPPRQEGRRHEEPCDG